MNDTLTKVLSNTKLAMGIGSGVVGILFFFFMLKTGVQANADDILDVKLTLTGHIEDHRIFAGTLSENNLNIKLLQQQVLYIRESVDKLSEDVTKMRDSKE